MKWINLAAILALAFTPLAVRAEHADIDLRLIHLDPKTGADKDETTASADREPPQGGYTPRPQATAKVDEPLALQFFLTNTFPHGVIKNVTVRYILIREEKPRQKNVPNLDKGAVTDGQFQMNFKPKCRVGARVTFRIKEPGYYLLRVETINTDSDHEHFSAIDVKVE